MKWVTNVSARVARM